MPPSSRIFYSYQQETPLGRASSCLSKWSRSPATGFLEVSGAHLLPASTSFFTTALSPCPSPTLQVIHHSSLPPPAPDAAIWLGVSSASTPLPPPGRDWVQLQPRSALGEVPRGVAVCVQSRDDGAGCSGGPGPLCPMGISRRKQLHHLPPPSLNPRSLVKRDKNIFSEF